MSGENPGQGAAGCQPADSSDPLPDQLRRAEALLDQAKTCTRHVLNAICEDPRKYWLLGNGTESWAKLTALHAALFGTTPEHIRQNFVPDRDRYLKYQDEMEADRRLLDFCRQRKITPNSIVEVLE